jgi:photosystem II stability/assembly factor-like uncharacterized protein
MRYLKYSKRSQAYSWERGNKEKKRISILHWIVLSSVLLAATIAQAENPLDLISHRHKLYDVTAYNNELFVVGYPSILLSSKDQGKTFQPLDAGKDEVLFAIDIARDGKGFIVGRSGVIRATQDGGKTWTRKDSQNKSHLFDVAAVEGGNAWIVGQLGTILHTKDGGVTWEQQKYEVAFSDQKGGAPSISIAEEENEGAAEEARLNSVAFADAKNGWIVGEFGLILRTTDGGETWKRQHGPSGKLLFKVHTFDKDHALIAGAEGSLMETDDGGTSWKVIETDKAENLLGLFASGSKLSIVGTQGLFMVRNVPAEKFATISLGIYTWLNSVCFLDEKIGFIVGGRGSLLRTTDGGLSWQRLSGR